MTAEIKVRKPNDADRLINVHGYSEEFLDTICSLIDDVNNPGWLFFIGPDESQVQLVSNVKRARPDLDDKKWLASKPGIEKNGAVIPFSLASEECAYHLVDAVKCKGKPQTEEGELYRGKIKAIVLFDQEGKEQWLQHVLRCCERLKAYRLIGDAPNGAMEVCAWDEGIPLSVDLTAPQDVESGLPAIPRSAMHGKCYEMACQTRCPFGYAYISVVTGASVLVNGNCNVRPNIFGAPLGDIHSGKSLSASRALMLLGLQDEHGNPIGDQLVVGTPASDRGLYKLFPDKDLVKRVLYEDEGRALLGKGNIQGSTLISVLCAMFSRNRGGVADKFGKLELNVQLSMLLNFKVRDASEFPEIFTHATSHGLWDRFLFGVLGDEKWRYTPWDFSAERDVFKIKPSTPQVPQETFQAAHAWSAAGEDRDRLAELALRVAYVTAAINGDVQVGPEAMKAALRLMEWQEQIRKVFQPAKGANEAEECVKTVLSAFTKANGYSYNFRDMARKHHWYEKFARTLLMTKKNLVTEKLIGFDKATGRHYLTEEQSQ